MTEIQAIFNDTAQDEVRRTLLSMGILDVTSLAENEPALQRLLASIAEIFSSDLPKLTGDMDTDLMRVSRDINLSRLFRNRGIILFWQVLNTHNDGVPIFQYFNHPYEERPFRNMTEFIDWFSRDAHISRDLIFRNIAAIERALSLGLSLDQIYEYLNKYAHAFRETLKNVLIWDEETRRKLVGIDPDIAISIVEHLDPINSDEIVELAKEIKNDPSKDNGNLTEKMKPYIIQLLDEVTSQESAKDAMRFVKHDILERPEITYRWVADGGYIEITLVRTSIAQSGEKFTDGVETVNLLLDAINIPEEILQDLIKRLPIVNRQMVDV